MAHLKHYRIHGPLAMWSNVLDLGELNKKHSEHVSIMYRDLRTHTFCSWVIIWHARSSISANRPFRWTQSVCIYKPSLTPSQMKRIRRSFPINSLLEFFKKPWTEWMKNKFLSCLKFFQGIFMGILNLKHERAVGINFFRLQRAYSSLQRKEKVNGKNNGRKAKVRPLRSWVLSNKLNIYTYNAFCVPNTNS